MPTPPNFSERIDRRGTHSAKWDMMESIYGVPSEGGIAMWVADMDFRPPACVQAALEYMTGHGIYGYFGDDRAYVDAVLKDGGDRARAIAETTMRSVRDIIGLLQD